jgi:hypothetical protein
LDVWANGEDLANMPVRDIDRTLADLRRGFLTSSEAYNFLIQEAAITKPAVIASSLPSAILQQLRDLTQNPPAAPREVIVGIGGIHNWTEEEAHVWIAEQQRTWYEGCWRWHDHFKAIQIS